MTPSITNIEDSIKRFFENRISYSPVVKQLVALTKELSDSIHDNLVITKNKTIAPNVFKILVNNKLFDNAELLIEWVDFAYTYIDEINNENSFQVNGPIKINLLTDETLETSFSIMTEMSTFHAGNTIQIKKNEKQETQKISSANMLFPDGEYFSLFGDCTTIGRDIENDIVIDNLRISRVHAKIIRAPDGYKIIDNNSTVGTFVNGNQITNHLLVNGDVIRFGDVSAIFLIDSNNSDNANILTKRLDP